MAEKEEKGKDEEGGEAQAAAAAPSGGSGKMKILMIVGFVIVLCAVAGTSILIVTKKNAKATEQIEADAAANGEPSLAPEGAGEEEELGEDEERLGTIIPMETFVVNLTGGKYLRAQIQFEFESVEVPSRFVSRIVPVRDGIITILTKKSQADIESAKGKEDLKREIKDFVNETLKKEDVKRVYFTQFVVQ